MLKFKDFEDHGFKVGGVEYSAYRKTIALDDLDGRAYVNAKNKMETLDETPVSFVKDGTRWKVKYVDGELIAQHWCRLYTLFRGEEAMRLYESEGKVLHVSYSLTYFPSVSVAVDIDEKTVWDDIAVAVKKFLIGVPESVSDDEAREIRAVKKKAAERVRKITEAVAVWDK